MDGRRRSEESMMKSVYQFVREWSGESPSLHSQRTPLTNSANLEDGPISSEEAIEMRPLLGTDNEFRGNAYTDAALNEWHRLLNVETFLEQIYDYYEGKGFVAIMLSRLVEFFKLVFVVAFAVFLWVCVDWSFLKEPATAESHPKLWEVVSFSRLLRVGWLTLLALIILGAFAGMKLKGILGDEWMAMRKIQRFYYGILNVTDEQLTEIEFGEIIERLLSFRHKHRNLLNFPTNAMEFTNIIMKRENYLIALYNKDVFDFSIPILGISVPMTKVIQWNVNFCILDHIFDHSALLSLKETLDDVEALEDTINKRLFIMGIVNLILMPFIGLYMTLYFLLRYGEEIYKRPDMVGLRQYTTMAKWKLREFNELSHYFDFRLQNSQRKANKYLDQFNDEKLVQCSKLITFIVGSLVLVLLFCSIWNEDLLMHGEISEGKSIIWYLGLFGALIAVGRAMGPGLEGTHRDPVRLMNEIIEFTHYYPEHWRGRLGSVQTMSEFSNLYTFKLAIVAQELISIIFVPPLLLFTFPKCTRGIIEFFREFTIYREPMGNICSFAIFDFERHAADKEIEAGKGSNQQSPADLATKEAKMEKSFISFAANNPKWNTAAAKDSSIFIDRLKNAEQKILQANLENISEGEENSRWEGEEPVAKPSKPLKTPGGLMSILHSYNALEK